MLKPEIKKLVDTGKMLPLMEAFYTIQGEGYHKGTAAYFIRVGGCDVGCHWCDVKESWDADVHPPTAIEVIATQATEFSDTIVVTGGEPLMWDMQPLTKLLKEKKLKTHIETSWTLKRQVPDKPKNIAVVPSCPTLALQCMGKVFL